VAVNLSKTRRVQVEAEAWALSQKCWSQGRIAEHLGVDRTTVCRALKRVRGRAIATLDADAKLWLVGILEQLEHVADEAMQAWERSKKPKKKAARRSASPGSTAAADSLGLSIGSRAVDHTVTEVTEREGEPAYLTAYFHAIDRIRALLNLDSRVKPAERDDQGDTPTVRDVVAELLEADAAYVPDGPPGEPPPSPADIPPEAGG
jgi:hypothetical protein